jgi:DUF4097 and DUF4098 domain-containing protein YvlB
VSYRETKTFPATAGKLVRLELASLDPLIRVAEATEITVTVALEARSSSGRAAQRWVARHTPVFEDSESTLEVRLPRRPHGAFVVGMLHTSDTVEVTIPPGCRLEVRSTSGDVELEGTAALAGPVRLNTASGDVGVRGGASALVVKTASGDVRVTGGTVEQLEVETASGDVTVEASTARALVDTASGSIRLRSLTGDLSVDTTSGDVRATWVSLPATGRVSVRTTSGGVRLRMPVTPALAGRLSTSSGRIVSDVDGAWGRSHRSLEIGAAAGGVELDVRTTSGDIHLDTTRAEL